jgi:hypothetical protein
MPEASNIDDKSRPYSLVSVLLLEFSGSTTPPREEGEGLVLTARVENLRFVNDVGYHFFTCNFVAARYAEEDKQPMKLSATYGCLLDSSERNPDIVALWAEELAKTSLWPRFSDLFAVSSSQMRRRMPLLPMTPHDVSVETMSDEVAGLVDAQGGKASRRVTEKRGDSRTPKRRKPSGISGASR